MPCLVKWNAKAIRISQIFIIYYEFSVDCFAQDTLGCAGDGPIDGLKLTGRLDDFGGNRIVGVMGDGDTGLETSVLQLLGYGRPLLIDYLPNNGGNQAPGKCTTFLHLVVELT